jgi:hypothetical protein
MAPAAMPRRSHSATRGRRLRAGSVKEQAESHVPTLKGVGKSDCEVKIVSILDCENLVPIDALQDHSSSGSVFPLVKQSVLINDSLRRTRYAKNPRRCKITFTEPSRGKSVFFGRLKSSSSTKGT